MLVHKLAGTKIDSIRYMSIGIIPRAVPTTELVVLWLYRGTTSSDINHL